MNIPSSALNAGYSAGAIGAFGENVFISEQTNGAALLFVSHNGGVSFTKSTPSKLISMQGCALTAVSTKELWAECPTGMLVSLLFSNDAGRTWRSLAHHQYGGTSGGFFATAVTTSRTLTSVLIHETSIGSTSERGASTPLAN